MLKLISLQKKKCSGQVKLRAFLCAQHYRFIFHQVFTPRAKPTKTNPKPQTRTSARPKMANPNIDHIPPSRGEKVPPGGGLWLAKNSQIILCASLACKVRETTHKKRGRAVAKKVNVYLRSWNKISDPLRGHKDQTGIFRWKQKKKWTEKVSTFLFHPNFS